MSQTIYDTTPMRQVFKEGTWDVKLSFLVMGMANLVNKQFTKGLLFLLSEIAFLAAFVIQIIPALQGMISLGTKEQGEAVKEVNGVKLTVQVAGDNSMFLLIFGLASLIFCAVFVYIYWCNLKSARHLMALKQSGRKVPNFIEDFKTLADGRFHMGLMTVPLIGVLFFTILPLIYMLKVFSMALHLVLFFTILPLIYMVCLAFTNFDHNHPAPKSLFDWVGFATFGQVLEGRMAGTFFLLLTWTLIWAVAATATTFFFGIVLALLINTKGLKFKKVWLTLFVITIAVPQFVSLLLMRNFLNDDGPLNGVLQTFHITNGPLPFLTDPLWAKFSIIFVNMWIGIPFTMLVATGIIMNFPTEQIEAAEIDGASKFQIFKNITFPQILLIMTPSLIQQFIGNINNFNVIYFLTGGGPTNSDYYGSIISVVGKTTVGIIELFECTQKVP